MNEQLKRCGECVWFSPDKTKIGEQILDNFCVLLPAFERRRHPSIQSGEPPLRFGLRMCVADVGLDVKLTFSMRTCDFPESFIPRRVN